MEMEGYNLPCGEYGGEHGGEYGGEYGGEHGGEHGGVIPAREDEERGGKETIMKGYETKR